MEKVSGKGLSTNDFTTEEKNKLAGIVEGATKVTVDSSLSLSSTNPVQNKVVNSALAGKMAVSQKGVAGGVAELDFSGKVPVAQLPSYVDDVIEGYLSGGKIYEESSHSTEITGETGKIYVDLASGKTYRWSGTTFVEISASLALGTTSSTAFRGDQGKTAYDHSQLASGNPHGVTKSDVGLGNVTDVRQMAGLSSGTTQNHVIVFGADGYTPKDSGFTIGKSVPSSAVFTDTTYSTFKGATTSAAGGAGLVPAPATGKNTSFLRGDGTWAIPEEPAYSVATQSQNGLMSATDKKKLDGLTEMTADDLDAMFDEIFA